MIRSALTALVFTLTLSALTLPGVARVDAAPAPAPAPASASVTTDEEDEEEPAARIVVEPAALELAVGDTAQLTASVIGADGAPLEVELMYFSRARRAVSVDAEGRVEAFAPGTHELVVRTRRGASGDGGEEQEGRRELGERLTATVEVVVPRPPVTSLELEVPSPLYARSTVGLTTRVLADGGLELADVPVELASSDADVAAIDAFGRLELRAPGRVRLVARCEGVTAERDVEVRPDPVRELSLTASANEVRTGDVVRLWAAASDGAARLDDVPVQVAVAARPDDDLGPPASGQVERSPRARALGGPWSEWRFVAETPGLYTLVATAGRQVAQATVRVTERSYPARLELVGRGQVSDTHTSDLWVWEGALGRDWAVTGTWGADGEAHFWDVTDPSAIERVATVQVDARTVNDVKVSEDGRLCVLSREGASDRKNGIVLVDVTNPREPRVLGEYDEGLTGGVHNLFLWNGHVFALSNGRRYDIIDVSDPTAPKTVGRYELEEPGHSIHDVWVVDGLAFSSNWSYGVHVVDVGNGIAGGSVENPIHVGDYAYPSGWNHAAFPYHDAETDTFYVVAGDEAFPYGLNVEDKPTYPRGWLHFIDFTDFEDPIEVARYQVPEAGTHNFWIDADGLLWVGYYNGGLRVVDVSGELMGDLYRQGREVDFFLPDDPDGFIANAPMVWGPQPHKGNVFFSDWNSGLWCVRLVEETGE